MAGVALSVSFTGRANVIALVKWLKGLIARGREIDIMNYIQVKDNGQITSAPGGHMARLTEEQREAYVGMMAAAAELGASAVERVVSGWNKTSEVLPDVIGSYLIVKDSYEGREIEWAFFNSNKQWCATTGYFIDDEVTHWRGLPALPDR